MARSTTGRSGARFVVTVCGLVVALAGAAHADQILQIHTDGLTSYLAGASPLQGAAPIHLQRGVGIDGSLRAGGAFRWAMNGSPAGESWNAMARLGPVNLAAGTYAPTEIDVALPAQVPWVIGRSFNGRQVVSAAHADSNGPQGYNWFQLSQPELKRFEGASDDLDVVYLVYGADRFIEFHRTSLTSVYYRAKNGAAGILEYVSGSPDTYVYYDQRGWRTYFFGGNTSSNRADWQVWKMVDPAGNIAYVGDSSTASTAATNGYNTDKTITKAYDSAGRRYCYSYTSVGVSRLTQVLVETDAGGGWGSCGDETLVAQVNYDYYTADGDDHGKQGDLKLVTITTPLSDAGINLVRRQYYRYYDDAWSDSDGRRGEPHEIKMVVGYDGTRRRDFDADSTIETSTAEFLTDSDSTLKEYSSAFFEYVSSSDYRIKKAFFEGECGCGGGVNGLYEFTYADSSSAATYLANAQYDNGWCTRTVVKQPDAIYFTQYFDETGLPLSRVVTDAAPSGAYTDMWATEVTRTAWDGTNKVGGFLESIYSPASNTGYTHDTTGSPTGTYTHSNSVGMVTAFARDTSSATRGLLTGTTVQEGATGTAYYVSWGSYTTRDFQVASGVNVSRPLTSAQRRFIASDVDDPVDVGLSASDDYNETSFTYTFWSTTNTNIQYLALKKVLATNPVVTTGKNGSNAATTSARYIRQDGSTAFAEAPDGIFTYTAFTNGQQVTRKDDVITNGSFPSGDDPNTDWGITESGSGSDRTTLDSYDVRGGSDVTTLPSGRKVKTYYSKLKDERLVTITFPRMTSGPTTFFGPASYSVANQAGKGEFSGTIAITSAGLTDALTGWIDETDADPITALDKGTLATMGTSLYNKAGGRLTERRAYFLIPGSGAGSAGTNYDATTFGYDDNGRLRRTAEATGTIRRTYFDDLGRTSYTKIGTDDTGEAGSGMAGSSNMVKDHETEYDSAADGGNSLVTKRTDYVVNSTTDRRDTTYQYDYRGRLIVTVNPQAPHVLVKLDNMGRTVAVGTYSSSSGLDPTDDPTALTTTRVGLSQSFYDELGRVWKSQRHKIDVSDGSDDDNLQTLTWRDAAGRVTKVDGEQLTKTVYDRLGRATHSFVLASDNDSVYADADDVSGDVVLEEAQTTYESTDSDNVVMRATIARFHDDLGAGTTGALDTNADGGTPNAFKYTAADVLGRIQITAMWYDDLDRVIDTVSYGTYSGSTFDRKPSGSWLTVPARSDTALRTTTTYNDDGTVLEVLDPRALAVRYTYDALRRVTVEIRNYVNGTPSGVTGDDDITTRREYANGLMTKLWVDLDGDNVKDSDDQVTTYIFGSTKDTPSQMKIATGHLLRTVKYPDTSNGGTTVANIDSDSSDVVSYAYNAQGQVTYTKDQEGNIVENDLDTGGRETQRRISTLDADFDGAVRRVATTYTGRGQVELVTQYDDPDVGEGSVVDEVKYTYDNWGPVSKIEEDKDSVVGGGGDTDYEVSYGYAKATTGRNTIRRTGITMPNATVLDYIYDSSGNVLDSAASRVTSVRLNAAFTVYAAYKYNGVAQVVGTDLPVPDAMWNLYTSTGNYPDLDIFDRVTSSRWTRDLATDRDFVDLDITYDRDSSPTHIEDNVNTTGVLGAGNGLFDAKYTVDNLNRLTQTEEGNWTGSAINNRTRQQDWTLTQTGNWSNEKLDLNGDNDWSDTREYQADGTFKKSNEETDRDLDTNNTAGYENTYDLTWDAYGNLTDDAKDYEYQYDPFGRLRKVKNTSNQALVAEYRYNGLGWRIGWHYDVDADGTVESNSDDPWYYFVYDEAWKMLATYRSSDANPKEQFYNHNAGLGGFGGSSYTDAVILRNKDASTAWSAAADSLDQVVYYCQNWRGDVAAILTDTGKMVEWVKYSSYGVPFGLPAGDTDSDGDWDATDSTTIGGIGPSYDIRRDAELDGDVDATDITHANSITGGAQTLGRAKLSSTGVINRKGYAGYEFGQALEGTKWHVRHRFLDSTLGRWTTRDPLGYLDTTTLYEYVSEMPLTDTDPTGLVPSACVQQCAHDLYESISRYRNIKPSSTCGFPLKQAVLGCCAISCAGTLTGYPVYKCVESAINDYHKCIDDQCPVSGNSCKTWPPRTPAPVPSPLQKFPSLPTSSPPPCFTQNCFGIFSTGEQCVQCCLTNCPGGSPGDNRDLSLQCHDWCDVLPHRIDPMSIAPPMKHGGVIGLGVAVAPL